VTHDLTGGDRPVRGARGDGQQGSPTSPIGLAASRGQERADPRPERLAAAPVRQAISLLHEEPAPPTRDRFVFRASIPDGSAPASWFGPDHPPEEHSIDGLRDIPMRRINHDRRPTPLLKSFHLKDSVESDSCAVSERFTFVTEP